MNVGTQMAGSGLSYNFCDRNITINFMWGVQRESSFVACLHLTLFLVDLKMHPSSICSSVRAVSVSHCMQGRLFLLRWYTKPPLLSDRLTSSIVLLRGIATDHAEDIGHT